MAVPDPNAFERGLFQRYNRDGINLIVNGLEWLILALIIDVPIEQWFLLIGLVVLFPVAYFFRRWWNHTVLYPRLGYFKSSPAMNRNWAKRQTPRLLLPVLGMTALLVVVLTLSASGHLPKHSPVPKTWNFGTFLLFLVSLTFAGQTSELTLSFLLASGWAALLFVSTVFLHVHPLYGMLISAAGALIIGVRKLSRFLKENPVLEGEPDANP